MSQGCHENYRQICLWARAVFKCLLSLVHPSATFKLYFFEYLLKQRTALTALTETMTYNTATLDLFSRNQCQLTILFLFQVR